MCLTLWLHVISSWHIYDILYKKHVYVQKPAAAVLLQPLVVTEFRWQIVLVDFMTQLPETAAGHMIIVVFVGARQLPETASRVSNCNCKMVHFAP